MPCRGSAGSAKAEGLLRSKQTYRDGSEILLLLFFSSWADSVERQVKTSRVEVGGQLANDAAGAASLPGSVLSSKSSDSTHVKMA